MFEDMWTAADWPVNRKRTRLNWVLGQPNWDRNSNFSSHHRPTRPVGPVALSLPIGVANHLFF